MCTLHYNQSVHVKLIFISYNRIYGIRRQVLIFYLNVCVKWNHLWACCVYKYVNILWWGKSSSFIELWRFLFFKLEVGNLFTVFPIFKVHISLWKLQQKETLRVALCANQLVRCHVSNTFIAYIQTFKRFFIFTILFQTNNEVPLRITKFYFNNFNLAFILYTCNVACIDFTLTTLILLANLGANIYSFFNIILYYSTLCLLFFVLFHTRHIKNTTKLAC